MTTRNVHVEALSDSAMVTGADTDASGQTAVSLGSLRQIESAADASAQASGGYLANVVSVSGNTVTVEIRENASASGEFPLVTSGSGVTDLHVSAEGQ